jgi:hypothetical protein
MAVKYAEIAESLSASRLKTYRVGLSVAESALHTSEAVKAYYLLNDISQHFFMPLQLVEVVLRNRLNNHIHNLTGKATWYDSVPAMLKTKDAVIKAKQVAKEEVENPTPDDIVCRLTFGFWANLLDSSQRDSAKPDHFIWDQHDFKKVFLGADGTLKVGIASMRLLKVNGLRNRLFHHEPIWKSKRVNSLASAIGCLEHQYQDLTEVLGWLSPEMLALFKAWGFEGRLKLACDAARFDRGLW